MTNRSKQLTLDQVTPGMVLSDDLLDDQGKILLPQGITLTEAILASLKRHDIETLPILFEALSVEDEAAETELIKKRLAKLFRKHPNDEASNRMLQYVTHFRLGDKS